MLKVQHIKALDSFVLGTAANIHAFAVWFAGVFDPVIVNLSYKVAESAATRITKAADKVQALHDDKAEATSDYIVAVNSLRENIARLEAALLDAHEARLSQIEGKMADAHNAAVQAEFAYDRLVEDIEYSLGVRIK